MRERFDLANVLSRFAYSVYAIGLIVVCLLMAQELLIWLRFGIWRTLLTKDVVTLPQSTWIGVRRISTFFEELPFAAPACLATIMLGWGTQRLADRVRADHKTTRLRSSWPPPL